MRQWASFADFLIRPTVSLFVRQRARRQLVQIALAYPIEDELIERGIASHAGMAELVDALDLGSSELARAGSSPVLGIFIGFSNYPRNPLINRDLQWKISGFQSIEIASKCHFMHRIANSIARCVARQADPSETGGSRG